MVMTGIVLTGLIILTVVAAGWLFQKSGRGRAKKVILGINFLLFIGLIFWSMNLIIPNLASAAEISGETANSSSGLGYLAAGLAVGLASIGAGIGVGIAGAAAIGAISEKPEILGRTLIFIGLAEGVAIYGLIISIMILGRL